MELPIYFGIFEKDFSDALPDSALRAVLGVHYEADGRIRLPNPTGGLLVVDDSVLPETEPMPLRAEGFAGVFFDFERPRNQVCEQILRSFSRQGDQLLILPPDYRDVREGLICVPQPLCNSWERFCIACEKNYAGGWCLELRPVQVTIPLPCSWPVSISGQALVERSADGRQCHLRDTTHTLRRKLAVAAEHGCRLGIGLYGELAGVWA